MKKLLKWVLSLTVFAALAGTVIFFGMGIYTANEFESRESLFAGGSGRGNARLYAVRRSFPMLYQATIAVEDAHFYSHQAVDLKALIRAGLSQIVPWMPKSGGSTIDMQTVKNLYGQYDGTPVWKAGEIVLATRLDKICTKDQILSLYVNIINYGNNFHGIRQAANGYFGVEPWELTDAQATLLAGIPQSPSALNPLVHFDAAKAKQEIVLRAMVRNDMITQEQADAIYEQDCGIDQYIEPASAEETMDYSIVSSMNRNRRWRFLSGWRMPIHLCCRRRPWRSQLRSVFDFCGLSIPQFATPHSISCPFWSFHWKGRKGLKSIKQKYRTALLNPKAGTLFFFGAFWKDLDQDGAF
ncbi:biosynthetic peptidoglycan transglycosylase [Allobaculum sp. Allo2]|uniref:biosynthetic peptidoglycan transglycosylase n=1 Tax=Allobaculum sp. Allo2 TaxID=2853432 RepID=UPI001F611DB1|nr:biosynthetic peptidoglycan transglycosylase [Allobaculum sp. Allo2]UNT94336.1 transglycosylase domain-containing protein [Allobaculum sp. Allo2]